MTDSQSISDTIDTARQFVDLVDIAGDALSGDGWLLLYSLIYNTRTRSVQTLDASIEVLVWLVSALASELKECFFSDSCAWSLFEALNSREPNEVIDCILRLGPVNAIDVARDPNGYSPLHYAVSSTCQPLFGPLLAWKPDLHIFGYNDRHSPKPESPTSLAMYSVWTFRHWYSTILDLGVQIEDLVRQEIEKGPLSSSGWKESTLLLLFDGSMQGLLDLFSPEPAFVKSCNDCGWRCWDMYTQPYWLLILEDVKKGVRPKDCLAAQMIRRRGELAPTWKDESKEFGLKTELERFEANEGPKSVGDDLKWNERSYDGSGDLEEEDGTAQDIEDSGRDGETDHDSERSTSTEEYRCSYGVNDIVCMKCWFEFKRTGQRHLKVESGSSSDEDEYSPFYVHS